MGQDASGQLWTMPSQGIEDPQAQIQSQQSTASQDFEESQPKAAFSLKAALLSLWHSLRHCTRARSKGRLQRSLIGDTLCSLQAFPLTLPPQAACVCDACLMTVCKALKLLEDEQESALNVHEMHVLSRWSLA